MESQRSNRQKTKLRNVIVYGLGKVFMMELRRNGYE
jgi:hypothetical protein